MTQSKACNPRCHIPWQQMVIDSSGVVVPCCYWGAYGNNNPPLGNINDNTIEEIWNGEGYQQLRADMARGDLTGTGCDDCYALKQGMGLDFDYDETCEEEIGEKTSYARNIEILKEEIICGATKLEAKPTIVSFTPSHRCNIRCLHCYQESTRNLDLNRTKAEREVEELAPYLVRLIAGGGEPFLLPIWNRFLMEFDMSKNPYLDFATTTNATIVSPKVLDGLARFKKLTMNISLDGTNEVFETVRVGANFNDVCKNINSLRKAVDKAPDKTSTLGITACVMKATILNLPEFVRFATKEALLFGLSPVITSPPDQSLTCFNKDPKKEIAGWDEALDEAEKLIETLYLPEMAKQRGSKEVTQTEIDFWHNNLGLIRNAIPFELAKQPHFPVTVALPPYFLKDLHPNLIDKRDAVVYIFPLGTKEENAAYWANIDKNEHFSATLPIGEFCLNVATKWSNASYWDHLRFEVTKEGKSINGPLHFIQSDYHHETLDRVRSAVRKLRWKTRKILEHGKADNCSL